MVVADKPFTTQGGTWMPVYYPGQYPISALSVDAPLIAFLGPDGDGSWQEEALAIVARERPKAHCACLSFTADLSWRLNAERLTATECFTWQTTMLVTAALKERSVGCLVIWLPFMDPMKQADAVTRSCIEQLASNGVFSSNARISIGQDPSSGIVHKYLDNINRQFGVKMLPKRTLQKTIMTGIGRSVAHALSNA
jgi:hypothetical protein